MKHRRTFVLSFVAVALVAAACSSGSAEEPAPTAAAPETSSSTTAAPTQTASPTTSTTVDPTPAFQLTTLPPQYVMASPLNGMGIHTTQADQADRRVVAVKIDNHWLARPQSGVQDAQAVYELLVEGGLTRFIALYHQSDSAYVGPIRSARPTDPTLLTFLHAPLQVSGGQPWVYGHFGAAGVPLLGDDRVSTYRIGDRQAPHNLYGTTIEMRHRADLRSLPDEAPTPIFEFGDDPTPTTATAAEVTLDWSDRPEVRWVFEDGHYQRFNGEDPHEWMTIDGRTGQVSADTLVVISAEKYMAGPSAGQSGSAVPALKTVGEGEAFVFYGGEMLEATWSREDIADPFLLTNPDGSEVVLPPGKLWISIFPTSSTLTWE